MSVRQGFVLLVSLSALSFLAACGGSNSGIATPVPPPSGSFGQNSLKGTYVFAVSGLDASGDAYSMAGTLSANGSGGITGGTLDLNDPAEISSPGFVADATINSNSTYSVTADGRAQTQIGTNISGLPTLTLDLALSSTSGGLVTEADTFGTGTGTIDIQTATDVTAGPYAFSLSGAVVNGSGTLGEVGNFTVASGGTISPAGLADFNDNAAAAYPAQTLTGTVAASSTGPATTLSTSLYPTLTFDVFPISSTHLKFIEMDMTALLSGDAFSQTSATMPTGTLPFTLLGAATGGAPFAAGGFMVTDGSGNIGSGSSEDFNDAGTLSPSGSVSFTGSYTAGGTGRYTLGNFSSFTGGSTYAAYPSSGGVLLLEIDTSGITSGVAYGPENTSATFAAGQGYALGLSGVFLQEGANIYDSGEFATASSGLTLSSGAIDEGYYSTNTGSVSAYGVPLTNGTFTAPSGGRGGIVATASSSNGNNSTLNGGLSLIYYVVDGNTFPFIEYDSTQVSAGMFMLQNSTSSSSSAAKPQDMFVPHPLFRPGVKKSVKQKEN
jgi:hypothetical protein